VIANIEIDNLEAAIAQVEEFQLMIREELRDRPMLNIDFNAHSILDGAKCYLRRQINQIEFAERFSSREQPLSG
jgi:hypothetical protein